MSTPTQVIAAIVAELKTRLGNEVASVRAIGGALSLDLASLASFSSPGVYVACVRMPASARDYDPFAVDARFVAVCVARDARPDAPRHELTSDDVALNLAALVSRIISTSRFVDAEGNPVMTSAAFGLAAVNAFVPDLVRKGLSLWRVEWSQTFEITARDEVDVLSTLERLREIRITAEVGGPNVGDVAGHVEFEEG